jgi:predicted Zn-dependent protease
MTMTRTTKVLTAGLISFAALTLGGCTKNAATGKTIFTLGMNRDTEIALGAEAMPQFTQEFGGPVPNADLQAYVKEVGSKLAAVTEADYPSLPWEFTFLNSEVINAFALPGGKVFFTRGLASKLSSEAEMAGVLGHEVGHVTAQHGAQRIASSSAIQGGVAIAAVLVDSSGNQTAKEIGAVGIPALAIGGQVVQLRYGRKEELEADKLGMRYMSRIGYDPAAQGSVMKVLQAASGGNSQPEFLSTHPYPETRIEQINSLIAGEYAATQNNPQYQLKTNEYKQRMLGKLAMLPAAPDALRVRAYYANAGKPMLWCAHCREDAVKHGGVAQMVAHPVMVGMVAVTR